MADALGLGSGFSPEFRAKNADALESIRIGPSVGDVQASRPAGLGLSVASSAPGSSGLTLRGVAGAAARVVGGIATLGISEDVRRKIIENQENRAMLQQQMNAEMRTRNLETLALSLDITSKLAQNVASITDPEQKNAVRLQTEASIARENPELVDTFRAMMAHESLAFGEREKKLGDLIRSSPTFAGLLHTSPTAEVKLSAEQAMTVAGEWNRTQARGFIPKAKTKTRALLKTAAERFPERFGQIAEKDEGGKASVTTDEFEEIVSVLSNEDPDLDPAYRSQLIATAREYPEALGLVSSERIEESEKNLKIVMVNGKPTYVPRDEAIGREAPSAASTTVNVNTAKGAEGSIFTQVLEETGGNRRLAAGAITGDAFREPILGRWVFGVDKDRQKASDSRGFFKALEEVELAGQAVAEKFADTNAFDEIKNSAEALASAGDPVIERYLQALTDASSLRVKARSGAQATDVEMKRFMQQFPTVRSLAVGGKLTGTAVSKFQGLRAGAINEYTSIFQKEEQEDVERQLLEQFPTALGRSESSGDPRAQLVEQAERTLAEQLGRQPTPKEIAEFVRKAARSR
jgi:hypothetical protein